MLEQETLEVPATAAAESATSAKRESAKPSRAVEPHLLSADEVEVLYIEHRTLLLFIASRKFHIADGEAENLIQDVFLSFLQTCTRIDNVRSWLVAAMCNASRHFWRAQGRTESLPDDYANACDPKTWGTAEEHAMRLTMSKVVGYMQPKCRETLRLHYFEGRSANDIAKELETTPRYAEKLIHNCLRRAREIYTNITAVIR
ncbi:MAG TPA: sigma-70 family RNA polymerase sigma factor [Thermoanaerobaculia bacterium]|nr:sigma-70 family RNA polymerase sigma factor [Thermoanaerobaculia bacterium]